MNALTTQALSLLRPSLRGNPQLVSVVPLGDAVRYKVLLLSVNGKDLEAAVSDDLGHRFLQSRLHTPDFQRDLCRALKLTQIEVTRLTLKAKVHPPDVILKAIERSYPAELEIRVRKEIAAVIPREEATRMGVLLEGVKGTIVYSLCIDGNGERFLRERFQQKMFREAIAVNAGLQRDMARDLTLFKPRRVSREVLLVEIQKAYPESRATEIADQKIRAQVQRARAEHEGYVIQEGHQKKQISASETKEILHTIAAQAYLQKASDVEIYYELSKRELRYQLFVDDGWKPQKPYPVGLEIFHAVINLVKIEAGISGIEKEIPHDGQIHFNFYQDGRTFNFDGRVNLMPLTDTADRNARLFGVTMRVLRGGEEIRPIEKLGFLPFQIGLVQEIAQVTDGLLLVGGPTNSGKNGTLKSITALIKEYYPEKKFCSIEDPVEVGVPFMFQTEVPRSMDPTEFLPALLRSNPQGIQMTEIRDEKSAQFAFMAADTGIYTQATIHIRNPFQVLTRLAKYGIKPNEISETLISVIYQRLMPRLCPECSVEEDFEAYLDRSPRLRNILEYWKVDLGKFRPRKADKRGCERCIGGYNGRIGAFEIWMPGSQKFQLSDNTDINIIRETAIQHFSHWTLLRTALCHAYAQVVDLDSVMRITNGVDPVYEGVEGFRYKDVQARVRDMESEARGDQSSACGPDDETKPGGETGEEEDFIEAEIVSESN